MTPYHLAIRLIQITMLFGERSFQNQKSKIWGRRSLPLPWWIEEGPLPTLCTYPTRASVRPLIRRSTPSPPPAVFEQFELCDPLTGNESLQNADWLEHRTFLTLNLTQYLVPATTYKHINAQSCKQDFCSRPKLETKSFWSLVKTKTKTIRRPIVSKGLFVWLGGVVVA